MEEAGEKESGGHRGSRRSLSPGGDDSLTDFKSPKLEPPAPIRPRIVIDKKAKKPSFKDGHTCPLCMKYFAETSAGTSHTKSCAAKNKVSTKKLLAAVALQERQSNERVAIGLPAGPILRPKDNTPRRPREPVAKGDPDLQLALALSKSLRENQLEEELEEALLLAAEHRGDGRIIGFSSDIERRKTLTNFGFLTNKPAGVSEGPARTRRKKHLGPTILQTRSQEARDRLLTDRVAEILMGNEAITQVSREVTNVDLEPVKEQRVTLTSRLLREIHQTTKRVWDVARMPTKITDFYVDDLAPVILPTDFQQQENSEYLGEELKSNVEEDTDNKMNASSVRPEECRLEEEEREKMGRKSSEEYESVNEDAKDQLKIPSPNNIYIPGERQYRNTLPVDWRNTLNVSSMSDVIVLLENGHIWAHKLVFYVRCSNILLDCERNYDRKFSHVKEKISWPRVDLSTGLAFLEFIYSGLIENNISVFSDNAVTIGVRRLARKYKVKTLFDYLRRKQADFDKVNNFVSEEQVEHRKLGLCSPVVIDVNNAASETLETIEENLPECFERKDAAEKLECEKLCSPIVGQVERTSDDVETIEEDLPANVESNVAEEDRESSRSSPSRYNDEFSITETNTTILVKKTREGNLQSRDTDAMSVISIASSGRSRASMSPDLFDETTEEASVDSRRNSEETIEKNSHLSDNENSNLKILADLIAQNDFSSCSEVSRKSVPPTIIEDKTDDEKIRKFSCCPTQHAQTPKLRGNFEFRTKIKDSSRSQLFPEKQKSNLSLFIRKIQKMNAKGPLDSYTEDESMAEPPAQIKRRNPFNVNDLTDKSILDSSTKIPSKLARGRDGKRGLSVFDKPIESTNKVDPNETTAPTDDSLDANENMAQADKSCLVDDTLDTDDEDISMYSKYRKTHKHNNSISDYRKMLKKVENAEKEDKSDGSPMLPSEKPIDLTQESDYSDTDVVPPPRPLSLNKRNIAGDTSDSDSIHSAATAIACSNNLPHDLSDEEDSKDSKSREKRQKKEKTRGVRSVEDLKKTKENVGKYSIGILPEDVESCRNSSRNSNYDLLEGDEEIFARSWKSKTPSPSRSSVASSGEILSVGRKEKTKKGKKEVVSSVENLKKKARTVSNCSIDVSPEDVQSSRNSSRNSDYDLLEGDEEIFARSWKSRTPSPLAISPASAPPGGSFSSGHKRKSKEIRTKYDSFKEAKNPVNSPEYSDLDVFEIDEEMFARSLKKARVLRQSPSPPSRKRSVDRSDNSVSSRGKRSFVQDLERKNLTNSTAYPDIDVDDLITQNLRQNDETSRGSLDPLGNHRSSESSEKSDSSRRRRRSNGERRHTPGICIDDFGQTNSNKSSEGAKRNLPDCHYGVFEPDERVFTQSFNLPRQSPCRTFAPLPNCASTGTKNNNPPSTLKIPSPIVITSSPEFEVDAEMLDYPNDGQVAAASNRENLFAIADRNSPRRCYDDLAEVISPTNFEGSVQFFQDYFENPVERPTSPQPSTSWKCWNNCGAPASSIKTPLVRWNSMPVSTSECRAGCERSRTPKQSSRLVMSQDVTPPVNYDTMGTPELKKELSKFGIKPQSRTRARKLLTHIYNELHPLVSVSPVKNKSNDDIALSDEDEPPAKMFGNRTSEDSEYSDREIPLSRESVTRAANIIPEEMDFGNTMSPEDSDVTSIGSIKRAFNALLNEDKSMRIKMLTYEPLPLELLYSMLKARGFKCKCNDLMDFLDEECITFQVQSQRNNNRTRGKKTARGRKGNANTQKS